jgi:hypothetical protein
MFEGFFTLHVLLALLVGALIGVGLGRRSKTANEYYDRARAAWDLREAQLRAEIDRLREKYGDK